MQVAVGLPVALSVTSRSAFPSPESAPAVLNVRPLSVKLGFAPAPPLRWTLEANADGAAKAATTRTAAVMIDNRLKNERIVVSPPGAFRCFRSV